MNVLVVAEHRRGALRPATREAVAAAAALGSVTVLLVGGEAAIANELAHGVRAIESGETAHGAQRFAGGAGRHGSFER